MILIIIPGNYRHTNVIAALFLNCAIFLWLAALLILWRRRTTAPLRICWNAGKYASCIMGACLCSLLFLHMHAHTHAAAPHTRKHCFYPLISLTITYCLFFYSRPVPPCFAHRSLTDFKAKNLMLATFEQAAGLLRIVTSALRLLPSSKLHHVLLRVAAPTIELHHRLATEPQAVWFCVFECASYVSALACHMFVSACAL